MTWKQSQYNPLPPHLVELALDIVEKHDITLKTDRGWFDHAELYTYRHAQRFEASLTIYEEGRTWPGTLYEPPETEWKETTHTDSFIKIRALADWAKSHGFEIETAHRAY